RTRTARTARRARPAGPPARAGSRPAPPAPVDRRSPRGRARRAGRGPGPAPRPAAAAARRRTVRSAGSRRHLAALAAALTPMAEPADDLALLGHGGTSLRSPPP